LYFIIISVLTSVRKRLNGGEESEIVAEKVKYPAPHHHHHIRDKTLMSESEPPSLF
jgi:hypothetical protein